MDPERTAEQPPGPGAAAHAETWREVVAGAVSVLSLASIVLAWACLLGWLVGELASDRFYLTQFLEWVPTAAVLGAAGALLIAGWLLARVWAVLVRRPARGKRGRGALRWAWVSWGALLVYFFSVEAPLLRPRPPTPTPGADRFKLVYWNAAAWYQDGWEVGIAAADPDIVILAGLNSTKRLAELRRMMDGVVSVVMADRFTVLSRRPIARYGATSLGVARGQGIDPRFGLRGTNRSDSGHALFLEIQHPATARTAAGSSIIHVIDLPSDLSLLRWDVTARARSSIDSFAGPVFVPDPQGRWLARTPSGGSAGAPEAGPSGAAPVAGFPPPDIVVGDFNIPRGAASIRALSRGLPSAFAQAGRGYMASYPRRSPVLHLDQAFLGPGYRAFNYRLFDIGSGAHRAQVIDIARD